MTMFKGYYIIGFLLLSFSIYGQFQTQYSLNAFDPLMFNPAYRTTNNTGVFNLHGRKQWTTIEGTPFSQAANLLLPIPIRNTAITLNIQNEGIGIQKNLSIALGANYAYELNKTNKFIIGAQFNYINRQLNGSLIRTPEGIYSQGTIIHSDDMLPTLRVGGNTIGMNIGLSWIGKNMYSSFSIQNVNNPKINFNNNRVNIEYLKNYYFIFGIDIKMSDIWVIKPNVFIKTDAIQTQNDMNIFLEYKSVFGFGIGYRGLLQNNKDALIGNIEVKLGENYKLYYAYDFSISSLNSLNPATHELLLTYNLGNVFGTGKLPPTIYNPRFFK